MRASQRSNLILGVILCTIGYISNISFHEQALVADGRMDSIIPFIFQLGVFVPGNICLFEFIERRMEGIDRILIPDRFAWPLVVWNAIISGFSILSNLP